MPEGCVLDETAAEKDAGAEGAAAAVEAGAEAPLGRVHQLRLGELPGPWTTKHMLLLTSCLCILSRHI